MLDSMPEGLRAELDEVFARLPRLKGYFEEGKWLTFSLAMYHEGYAELRGRVEAFCAEYTIPTLN